MQILRGRGEGGLVPCPAGEGVALGEVAGIPRCIIGTLFRLGSGAGQWNGIRQDGGEELLPNAVFVRIHSCIVDAEGFLSLLDESLAQRMNVFDFAPNCTGAADYMELAKEILSRLDNQ